ncbi:MAG: hypothetical protein BWY70_00886 [Bacteroidetes bacterium ADurb.Bin408]|nr:MAG: hypothetical protein BWY70_00886 [Bacteroidetes bacterium ADurb.Bin408]
MKYVDLDFFHVAFLILGGLIAGFINVLAGSGSFITLPVMIFLGIPAPIANGTNRIAVFFQNMVSARSFYTNRLLPLKQALWLSLPSVAGSLIGAWIAVDINKKMMETAIGIIMLIMLAFMFYKPEKWLKSHKTEKASVPDLKWWHFMLLFFIGIYGGFIQAGVGVFLLVGLVLGINYDMVRANAIKAFINLVFTPFALIVFILSNQVDYVSGFILTAGSVTGAYIATRTAIRWGAVYIRWIVVAVIVFSSVKLLFF